MAEPPTGEGESGSRPFYVPPDRARAERAAFVEALGREQGTPRAIYDAYLDRIGANGILDGIESLHPICHDEAHDLGKSIQARLGNIGESLRACDRRCHSGCMHGVLMEAFRAICTVRGQIQLALLAQSVELVCLSEKEMRASYSIGDCAHGVGHAVMFLSEYSIDEALDACRGFRDERMRYYCATGAYMEFVTTGHADGTIREGLFRPCDTHAYPAACARYLMPRLLRSELVRTRSAKPVFELCRSQAGAARLGCFHGLGTALIPWIEAGAVRLAEVCSSASPDEQRVCIEGAVERMARYRPERAAEVCAALEGPGRSICEQAARNQMYNMDKDLSLYLPDSEPALEMQPLE